MSLPENVRDALDRMCTPLHETVLKGATAEEDARCMELIRAELHRLTEIAESVDPLVIRLGEVTTKLEAANALLYALKEACGALEAFKYQSQTAAQVLEEGLAAIDIYVKGAGDEA